MILIRQITKQTAISGYYFRNKSLRDNATRFIATIKISAIFAQLNKSVIGPGLSRLLVLFCKLAKTFSFLSQQVMEKFKLVFC